MATLLEKLARLPAKPGVYFHKDAKGKVLYVGKAANLRSRVRSYFPARTTVRSGRQTGADHSPKIAKMVTKSVDIDHIVTRSEVEALLLEANFIKQHKPPYNVRLRDDKQFLFAKVSVDEEWPRVMTVRNIADDRAKYFGPYTDARVLRSSLKTLRKIFPYCTCNEKYSDDLKRRPCLYYHLGQCPAPRYGRINNQDYRDILDQLIKFLDGQSTAITKDVEHRMKNAAGAKDFERAADWRDRLRALQNLTSDQQAIGTTLANRDVIGLARDDNQAVITLFNVRSGKVVTREQFSFWGTAETANEEIVDSFLGQYYKVATNIPPELLLPLAVPNAAVIGKYLTERLGKKVAVSVPRRGGKKQQVALAAANAAEHLRQLRQQWLQDQERTEGAIEELAAALRLPKVPARVECYDISTLTGTSTVGSMVVFTDGRPAKAHYRRFRIRHVKGLNDVAAVREILQRRFARLAQAEQRGSDQSFGSLPDLVIIDGGKAQVSAASQVLAERGLVDVPLIGLAKRLEEVVIQEVDTGKFRTLSLPRSSSGLYLLQRIRDEAHRFAISYNRQVRRQRGTRSALDELPGIGPKKKKQLLRSFGSVPRIRQAKLTDIQAVVGKAAGKVVKENL